MIYLDTSYLVKCYVCEPGTEEILAWLEGRTGLSCAEHGRLEFFSAVRRHVREGRLRPSDATGVFRRLEADEALGLWNWLPVGGDLIRETCRRIATMPAEVPLRSADALHLACAASGGFREVYSHDRHLLAAASYFGLSGIDLLQR